MNTPQIRKILKASIPIDYYTEVLPCDKLNLVPNKPFAIVINSDTSDSPGAHWLAIFMKQGSEEVEFFDSCAMPVKFYNSFVGSFLSSKGTKTRLNTVRLQSGDSNACGQYCIYFLLHRIVGIPYDRILQKFSAVDLECNDIIVQEFMRHNFGGDSAEDALDCENELKDLVQLSEVVSFILGYDIK